MWEHVTLWLGRQSQDSEHSGLMRNWQKGARAQSWWGLWGLASLEPRTP